jgi:hypothetical protein
MDANVNMTKSSSKVHQTAKVLVTTGIPTTSRMPASAFTLATVRMLAKEGDASNSSYFQKQQGLQQQQEGQQ